MQIMQTLLLKIHEYSQTIYEVEMTPIRKTLMTQWNNSSDATMVSQFNINVDCIEFFNKKYPSETLTTLMLQTVSLCLKENEVYRTYLNYKKLYRSKEAYTGIIVQLPGCRDQLGTIAFKNCHTMNANELAKRIRDILQMMTYCYQKREELEQLHPHLKLFEERTLLDFAHDIYNCSLPGSPIATVSNVGFWGYTNAKSPLLQNEVMKFVMLQVDRKQVWNKNSQSFVIEDHLPISISVDHRLFDGNNPVPKMLNDSFQRMFQKMQDGKNTSSSIKKPVNSENLIKTVEYMLHVNLDFGYQFISTLQTFWPDFLDPTELLSPLQKIKLSMKTLVDGVLSTDS